MQMTAKSWRRITGSGLLGLAIVFAGEWFRSQVTFHTIWIGIQGNCYAIVSVGGWIGVERRRHRQAVGWASHLLDADHASGLARILKRNALFACPYWGIVLILIILSGVVVFWPLKRGTVGWHWRQLWAASGIWLFGIAPSDG